MTRRIALAILTIVWLSLLTAGVSTYLITRSMLIADLDETIVGRVASLPQVERPALLTSIAPDTRDRFVVQNPEGRILSTPTVTAATVPPPVILAEEFTRIADGSRLRTLTVRAFARREDPAEPLVPLTVVYSASAQHVDALLSRLLISLSGFGLFAAAATAAVAKSVAAVALRPLRDTAEVIGAIDEKTLDRRINVERLPSELAPVGRRLNDMLTRLEIAFKHRKQFLADASHELRTPVAALVTTLEVALRRRRDPEEYLRTLETCLTDARLLHQLVVALLDQVRSERFTADIEICPVPAGALLGHCADLAATLASTKGISVHRDIPTHLDLFTDEQKLRSIVSNLVANAVEYTPPGGNVWLTVRLTSPPSGVAPRPLPTALAAAIPEGHARTPRLLVITVADDGVGIAPEHLPNLFEPFYRADAARANPGHHLGLGLALVRAGSRSLGGDCRVTSPRAPHLHGCEFVVEIPSVEVAPTDATLMESRRTAFPKSSLTQPVGSLMKTS